MSLCFSSSSLNFIPLSSLPMVFQCNETRFSNLIGSTKKRCFPVVSHRKIQKTSWGFRFKPGDNTGAKPFGFRDPGPTGSFEIDPLSFEKKKRRYAIWLDCFHTPSYDVFNIQSLQSCILYKKTTNKNSITNYNRPFEKTTLITWLVFSPPPACCDPLLVI